MTDALPPAETHEKTSRRTRRILAAVAVILIGLVAIGVIASRTGLDKALLRQQLDALAVSLAERGRESGRELTLTYSDIAIQGSFSNRHAVIFEPQLVSKPLPMAGKPVADNEIVTLRTPELEVYAKSVDLSKLLVRMGKPIEVLEGPNAGRKLLTIRPEAPLDTEVTRHKRDRAYLETVMTLPQTIQWEYLREQKAEGVEDATPTVVPVYEILTTTQAAGGTIRSDMAQDASGLGEAQVNITDLVLTPEVQPEGAVRVAEVKSEWRHSLTEKNHHLVEAKMHVGDITAPAELLPYAPIALVFDASYEGAAPQTAQDLAAIRAQESSIKLNRLAITTKEAALNATADFVASPTDVLPVGMANITLTNVPYVMEELRRHALIDANAEALIGQLLVLMTGTPLEQLKDASIDINRTRGGAFTIGQTTFEELFAAVLRHSIVRQPAPVAAPLAEAGEAPAAEPKKLEIEEGARG